MFSVTDEDNNLIAFHDDYDVCESYVNNIFNQHGTMLSINKIKKKNKYILEGKDDLYLVRYSHTYVQEGYLLYIQLASEQLLDDVMLARDVIYRIIGSGCVTEKRIKALKKAALILEDIYEEDSIYTPDIKTLKNMKYDYDPYFYNMGLY